MTLETGTYFEQNQKRLDALDDPDKEWAIALEKCRRHIGVRLKKRTLYGAHSESRLGEEPVQYYTSFAFTAILSGYWEWKEKHSLSEQMIRIADSTMSTEVEKVSTRKADAAAKTIYIDDWDLFYQQDAPDDDPSPMENLVMEHKIAHVERSITDDEELEFFWEGIKEGMDTNELAQYLHKTVKQLYKIRERFVKKIKHSPYFEID